MAWWHYWVETALEAEIHGSKHFSTPFAGTVLVLDLRGFGARHLNTTMLKQLISLFGIGQAKYPESLSKVRAQAGSTGRNLSPAQAECRRCWAPTCDKRRVVGMP